MDEQYAGKRYFELLSAYIADPNEEYLASLAALGRELLSAGMSEEDVAEIHENATLRIAAEQPTLILADVAHLLTAPLLEVLMAFSLEFRKEIHAHKRSVEALKREQEQLLGIFDGIDANIYVADLDTYEVLYANSFLRDISGGDPIGRLCYETFQGLEKPCPFCTNRIIREKPRKTHSWEHHDAVLKRDFLLFDRVISWPDGRDVRFELGIDITERKRAEEALLKTDRALRALSESNQILVRATEEAKLLPEICRVIVEVGQYPLAWIGFAQQDEEKTVRPVAQAGFEEGYLDTVNITWADTERGRGPTGTAIRTGKISIAQDTLTNPEFAPWREEAIKHGYASSLALPLHVNDHVLGALNIFASEPEAFDADELKLLMELSGDLSYGIAALRNRAERKRAEKEKQALEAQLRQSQKIKSIGTLASGVAHEINNPLTGMINYADLIAERVSDEQLRKFAQGIIKEGNRVAEIIKSLLYFSRQEKQSHSPARMEDIINASLTLIGAVLRKDQITVEKEIVPDLPQVRCRSQHIEQVIINLLTNARDALNQRYEGYHEDKLIRILVQPFEEDGIQWIRTTVEDHGMGISADVIDRIFDPFFTTKSRTEGTGLGLSVSYGIVKDHHGELTVESEPGKDTRFYLDLRVDNGWTLE